MFILLVSILIGTLYFKYKGHSKEELQRKEMKNVIMFYII